ncbi:MAG: acyl carrier protein [Prevotella sp.]
MERSEIFKKVNEIFCDELDNEDIVLNDDTTADYVEEWDSLSHVQLIVAIEKAFGIKFTSNEILSWSNVGQLVDSIENRLKK